MSDFLLFDWYVILESFLLIALGLGMLGARFYFNDFMNSEKVYSFWQVLFVMIFTVFLSEFLIILSGYFFIAENLIDAQIEVNTLKYRILFPHIFFYSSLCYFLYWVFKIFQQKQEYFISIKKQYDEMHEYISKIEQEKKDLEN
jgi:hypothetical protein